MTVLLVDERDGKILAEFENKQKAEAVLEDWAAHDADIPRYVSIMQLGTRQDAIFESEGWVKLGPLR